MQNVFGVLNNDGVHIDVSSSLRGAKNYASRNGYVEVSCRWNCGYNASVVARKDNNGKWVDVKEGIVQGNS